MRKPNWKDALARGRQQLPRKGDWRKAISTRSFRVGGYSMAAAAIVVVIAVVANLLVNALPASATQFDTSQGAMYTLSQETTDLLAGLEEDVTVYWIVQSGQEDETLSTLLDRYTGRSDHLILEKKDPDVAPGFLSEYVTGTVYNNSLIVTSDTRDTYVSYEDIYTYEYSDDYTSYNVSFNGESALTSAIDYVLRDTLPKVYTLTGHGEEDLTASFQAAVEKQNVDLEELSLLTSQSVPEDADCLLVCGPASDISQSELEAIQDYLDEGGDLILLTDPLQDGEERPNLDALMAQYGMSAAEGIVVEEDTSNYALGSPVYLLPDIQSHTITAPLVDGGYYIFLALAQGLVLDEDTGEDLVVESLLTTSDQAYSKAAGYGMETYSWEGGDTKGPFSLAAAATKTLDDGQESHVLWISSTALLDDQYNQQVSGANQDFFLNCVNWTCEGEESSMSIHAKTMTTEYLTISASTASLLTLLVVAVVPLCYLGFGLRVWIRRRRQ
ncbi:MAG TPA: GldG family protein [Candidatus Evtepia faecigallinarum]|nr:GldG family protein [Candidatus Evtepia faecigallinarum]